ncbi:MAG: hypothetical protein R3B47_19775 [Bacteroidia bacterium]
MRRLFLTSMLVGMIGLFFGQDVSIVGHSVIPRAERVILSELPQGQDPYFRNTEKAPEPGMYTDKAEWKAIEQRLLQEKREAMESGEYYRPVNNTRSNVPTPYVLQSLWQSLARGIPTTTKEPALPTGL